MEKNWYISNGSIVKYRLNRKNELDKKINLYESYNICKKPYFDGFLTQQNFVPLDKELFHEFMTGKISIDEVLNSTYETQKQKVK